MTNYQVVYKRGPDPEHSTYAVVGMGRDNEEHTLLEMVFNRLDEVDSARAHNTCEAMCDLANFADLEC